MLQIISGGLMKIWSQLMLRRTSTTPQSLPPIACPATGTKSSRRGQGRAGQGTCMSPSSPTQDALAPFRTSAKTTNGNCFKRCATNLWHLYLSGVVFTLDRVTYVELPHAVQIHVYTLFVLCLPSYHFDPQCRQSVELRCMSCHDSWATTCMLCSC